MTGSELEALFAERFEQGCSIRWGNLILEHELFGAVMDIARKPPETQLPFRAAYALERAFLFAPERFEPYYERFVADFPAVTHPSVWRHYGKIMAILLRKKKLTLTDAQAEQVAEAAVVRLVDESIRVGVRVWSLDILYDLRGRVAWLDRELPAIIDSLKINPSPGMISRLRRFGWLRR